MNQSIREERHGGLPQNLDATRSGATSMVLRDRLARHYSDMAALWRHPGHKRALNRMDILQDVVRHKSRFFASAWASYNTAKPGSFHLAPPEHRYAALAKDLNAMGPMFLSTPPAFKELLQQLAEAEEILNSSRG